MKRTPLKRRPWRKALGDPKLWIRFKLAVHDHDCAMAGRSFCAPGIDAHHIVPKQKLKQIGVTPEVLYDPRNALPLCPHHHARHTSAIERVPRSEIPASAWEFADELGLRWLIERTYPA